MRYTTEMICKNSVNEFYYQAVDKSVDSFSTVFSSFFILLIAHFLNATHQFVI